MLKSVAKQGVNKVLYKIGKYGGKKLNCLFVNARSISNNFKVEELSMYANIDNLDIIGVAESWLNEDILTSEISLEGFTVYRKDRSFIKGGRGGGVLLYIRHLLLSTECQELNICKNESIWCKILTLGNHELLVGVVYKSTGADPAEILNMELMLKSLSNRNLVIVGDFNYPGINWKTLEADHASDDFFNIIQDNFWTQHVLAPTRGQNTLDLVFSSEEGMIEEVTVCEHLANSDHSIVQFKLIFDAKIDSCANFGYNYNRGEYRKMNEWLCQIKWDQVFDQMEVESMWVSFRDTLKVAIDKYVPVCQQRKYKYPKWMTKRAVEARKCKIRMWKRYQSSGDYNDKVEYKRALNLATREYRVAKIDFERKLVKDIKVNPKSFYSYVRSKARTKDKVCPLKDKKGDIVVEDEGVCNILNEYFSSVYTEENITDDIPHISNTRELFLGDQQEVLHDIFITEEVVYNRLKKLKINKAPGVDGLVPRILVETAGSICRPLCLIFKMSLESGIVPKDWKRANISAIYKKGPKNDPSNYRPISLTSQICKLLETILRDSITDHLQRCRLIRDTQHGFVKKRSCLTNLLEFLEFTGSQIDNGNAVDVIYLDFQKAFDKVPHRRLIAKLEAHGVGGSVAKWIADWLSEREQRVMLNQSVSDWSKVLSGVPQGSVLGPLLFVIYINDIDTATVNKLLKFADDTKILSVVSSADQVRQLRLDLVNLFKWSQDWLMLFNLDKCKVMHFGKRNLKEQYYMGGRILEVVDQEQDLGVIIQNDLKVTKQCVKAANTANRILGMISRTFVYKSSHIICQLYKSLVRPHLEYCAQTWRPHLEKDKLLLERVQRRATRMVSTFKGVSYSERLHVLKLTTLETRRLRGDLIQVFKIVKGFDDVNMSIFFDFSTTHLRGHSYKLFKPRVSSDCGKFSFGARVVDEWNLLTEDIVSCNTVELFKNRLDHYLRTCRGFI
jgi:ribonucleases P/MRP protein subunit RPP40